MPSVPEIDPAAFERDLREGADVVVLDTRPPHAFAEWHVQPARGRTINVTESELYAEPEKARGLVHDASPLYVICNSGTASRRVAELLEEHGIEALSVHGGMIGWSRVLRRDDVLVAGPFSVVQFRREARGCLSYLVVAGREALVVDPGPDVQPYLDEAEARGTGIVRVFDTHIHADHLSGARELAERTGATLSLSPASLARGVSYADRVDTLADGDVFDLGGETVRAVALPGHTSDMTGLLLGHVALIGGDSLFADSVARPDLEAGDEGADEGARQLHHTLHAKIDPLPGSTLLLPCHYAGGRLDGPLAVPLADVRRDVPELGLGEEAFVERILGQMPPKPANFVAIIGVNLGDEIAADDAARLEIGANNCAAKAEWAHATMQ